MDDTSPPNGDSIEVSAATTIGVMMPHLLPSSAHFHSNHSTPVHTQHSQITDTTTHNVSSRWWYSSEDWMVFLIPISRINLCISNSNSIQTSSPSMTFFSSFFFFFFFFSTQRQVYVIVHHIWIFTNYWVVGSPKNRSSDSSPSPNKPANYPELIHWEHAIYEFHWHL